MIGYIFQCTLNPKSNAASIRLPFKIRYNVPITSRPRTDSDDPRVDIENTKGFRSHRADTQRVALRSISAAFVPSTGGKEQNIPWSIAPTRISHSEKTTLPKEGCKSLLGVIRTANSGV